MVVTPLKLEELEHPIKYNTNRDLRLKEISEYKRNRRLKLGNIMSIIFENRKTLLFQLQEMMRLETDLDQEGLDFLLESYSQELPDRNILKATLFVEVSEESKIKPILQSLVGLENHVFLVIGNEKIKATFEEDRENGIQIASIQYISFYLTDEQRSKFIDSNVGLEITHPINSIKVTFSQDTIKSLAEDLGIK